MPFYARSFSALSPKHLIVASLAPRVSRRETNSGRELSTKTPNKSTASDSRETLSLQTLLRHLSFSPLSCCPRCCRCPSRVVVLPVSTRRCILAKDSSPTQSSSAPSISEVRPLKCHWAPFHVACGHPQYRQQSGNKSLTRPKPPT